MIKEDYCSFEVAKLLKEKWFPQEYDIYHSMVYNEEDYEDEYEVQRMVLQTKLVKAGTLSSYPISVPEPKCFCPTHQMAMAWLREIYGIDIVIEISDPSVKDRKYYCMIWDGNNNSYILDLFNSYEEAVETALKYSLENLI